MLRPYNMIVKNDARAKRRVLKFVERKPSLLRTVPKEYVHRLFEEEEDSIDYVCILLAPYMRGFALLTDKWLTSWVPPEWEWEHTSKRSKHETRYTHMPTGRVVYDDLDEVWKGGTSPTPTFSRCVRCTSRCFAPRRGTARPS